MITTCTERRVAVTADEVDVYGLGRRYLACLDRAGVVAKTKRRTRRRERRERDVDARAQARDALADR